MLRAELAELRKALAAIEAGAADAPAIGREGEDVLGQIQEIKQAEAELQRANDLLEQCVAQRTAALQESEGRLQKRL